MGFGGAGAAAAIGLGMMLVLVALLSIPLSIAFSFVSRRLLSWTPVVVMVASPLLAEQGFLFVLLLAAWLFLAWPRPWRSDVTSSGKKRWHPLLALAAPLAVQGVLIAGVFLSWNNSVKVASRPAAPAKPPSSKPATLEATRPAEPIKPIRRLASLAHLPEATHRGLTWVVLAERKENGTRYVLVGTDEHSDAYRGDAEPGALLPVLAIRPSSAPPPSDVDPNRWSGSQVGLSRDIFGYNLKSLEYANLFVEATVGEGWRMASFHEGEGWRFWAENYSEINPNQRFWVYIRDQPANPWS